VWPCPGMCAVIAMPLVRRTRATLRNAEFGFFGVFVYTRVQTPRRWGAPRSAGVLLLVVFDCRSLRISCCVVGMRISTLPGGFRGARTEELALLGQRNVALAVAVARADVG